MSLFTCLSSRALVVYDRNLPYQLQMVFKRTNHSTISNAINHRIRELVRRLPVSTTESTYFRRLIGRYRGNRTRDTNTFCILIVKNNNRTHMSVFDLNLTVKHGRYRYVSSKCTRQVHIVIVSTELHCYWGYQYFSE